MMMMMMMMAMMIMMMMMTMAEARRGKTSRCTTHACRSYTPEPAADNRLFLFYCSRSASCQPGRAVRVFNKSSQLLRLHAAAFVSLPPSLTHSLDRRPALSLASSLARRSPTHSLNRPLTRSLAGALIHAFAKSERSEAAPCCVISHASITLHSHEVRFVVALPKTKRE